MRCLLSFFLILLLCPAVSSPAQGKRPNLIIIMADDMGFSDIGCYGGEISTPNLDRLAANGLRFTQFYNTARCCPTRASLLTGLYPHQAGVGHMVGDYGKPGYRGFLNDRCVTIAEALRAHGYRTLLSGKWHVGERRPNWPVDRGFDDSYALISGGTSYFKLDEGRTMAINDGPYTPPAEGWYITDAISDHAAGFIGKYAPEEKPFFLYVAYTAPHWPLHALPEDIARYKGKYLKGWDALRKERHQRMVKLGLIDSKWDVTERDGQAPAWDDLSEAQRRDWDLKMAVYAAQIDSMDRGIGRILDQLKKSRVEQNTLVMFLADNGGCAEHIDRGTPGVPPGPRESFLSYGLPWANASNTPFRRYKHWVHEGGIATPLITHWPAGIKARGKIIHPAGHLIDLMPTCLEVAGASYPKTFEGRDILPLEGKSLSPIFQGKRREDHAALYWEHEGNRAVRQGKWKLVAENNKAWELYDLEKDRTETRNLAAQHPDKVTDLTQLYEVWAERCNVLPYEDALPKRPRKKQ